ncbi:MAG: ACP S-malonyltransferase [Clostridia bacterium]|nr:ACP S-malonyltransferase [Clostridia bacterium]
MKKIAFVFPGQGAQYVGMGKGIYDKFSVAKKVFEEASDSIGIDLRKLCFEESIEELTKTENTQPAILTASVAAFRVYMEEVGKAPEYLAGHSLGELSALTCSNAIKLADAVKIVRQRGRFMQEAVGLGIGAMAAVSGVDRQTIEEQCNKISRSDYTVVISNYNSPDQIVISGHKNAVDSAAEVLKGMGGRVIPLKVSAPFHSPLMQLAADRLEEELKNYTYSQLVYPVISNVTAIPYTGHDRIIENLSQQIVQPVRWQDSMAYLVRQGVELAVELGPQTVLKNLMKKNAPGIITYSYDREDDILALKKSLSSNEQSSEKGHVEQGLKLITKCIAEAVCTKNHNWNDEEYQKGVVEPFRKVRQLHDELVSQGKQPTLEQMKEAVEMLRTVFATKKVPSEEQIHRFGQIFSETGTQGVFTDFKIPE